MLKKYYILVLTFLCLFLGQVSYGLSIDEGSGREDEYDNFDWDSLIEQLETLIGAENVFVYDHTNIMDYVAVKNGDDDPFNDLIVTTFIDPDYVGKNVPDYFSGIVGPYVSTTHIEFAYIDGYDKSGFDPDGYDKSGFDVRGFNQNGYDRNGYDWRGYDENGYDINGYDINGYDIEGYNDANQLATTIDDNSGYNENTEAIDIYDATYDISSYDFELGKNNIFSANGRPLRSGDPGNLIQIEIRGNLYKPSELDPKKQGTVSALNKIAAFYAKEKGYSGLVITTASIGDKGGHDVANYGNGALTIRSVAFADGKFDNIYDFKSTLNHEILHWKDPRTVSSDYNFMDHANIYLQEASDPEFNKTSNSIKINNANQYMVRVLNGVGMNNTKILAAIKNYNDNNKGGVLISNAFYSGSLTGFSFTTSINGTIYENEFSYEVLSSPRD